MKQTKKRERTIQILEHFIPSGDWSTIVKNLPESKTIQEKPDGVTAEEAFFQKSERGIQPTAVTNVVRYLQLLYAQRRMALQITEWKKDLKSGLLRMDDLLPLEQELVR